MEKREVSAPEENQSETSRNNCNSSDKGSRTKLLARICLDSGREYSENQKNFSESPSLIMLREDYQKFFFSRMDQPSTRNGNIINFVTKEAVA